MINEKNERNKEKLYPHPRKKARQNPTNDSVKVGRELSVLRKDKNCYCEGPMTENHRNPSREKVAHAQPD